MKRKAVGMLPGPQWLQKNGYSGLVATMQKHPEAFAHIQRGRIHRKPNEWVAVAEKLARIHEGILPNGGWLVKNSYSGLYQTMRHRPELFAHIKQTKRGHTLEEWVSMAEKLEEKQGKLPSSCWLTRNSYSGLYNAMQKQPEAFTHIRRGRTHHTPEEWVFIAETLEKERGQLPNTGWLQKNGYTGLDTAMREHPELFIDIKQKKVWHTLEAWVSIAKKMAKKHGTLPNPSWLNINGHRGLYDAMRKHPKLFAHIPQKRLR